MGKIKDYFIHLKTLWLDNRIQIQEANIRSAVEKKITLQQKLDKLTKNSANTVSKAQISVTNHLSEVSAMADESTAMELKYKYNKIQNKPIVKTIKNIFSISRKYRFISRIFAGASMLFALIETSAVMLIISIALIALLPFTLTVYLIYALTSFTKFKKYYQKIFVECTDKPLTVLIYTNKGKKILKDEICKENTDIFSKDSNLLIVTSNTPFISLSVKQCNDGVYLGHYRFFEYLRAKDLLDKDHTTLIWI